MVMLLKNVPVSNHLLFTIQMHACPTSRVQLCKCDPNLIMICVMDTTFTSGIGSSLNLNAV